MSNRLAKETSPYLLQHQHNPVDWYSWGPEAFSAAKAPNKPIFLSVGYSTCYWCHVMERQCFENESIASVMNKLFINIKVDREERPDVDQLYMTAVQLLTRQGGWPMSVFLLPDRRPFYGGTYFPPADGHGRPGFPRLLTALRDAYDNRRADVEQTADELTRAIKTVSNPVRESRPLNRAMIDRLIERSTTDYEPEFGGFGSAPKFPRETLLELLLVHHRREPNLEREGMIKHTLDAMANGGIRDQLGGGFHRYSTDARWLVPHFEIMLYDNAMLAWIYAEASQQFSNDRYGRIARGICDFVLRDMTDPAGSFYTAFDAEVDGQEGLNYLWTEIEIESVLEPEEASIFKRVYGLDEGPNFADPHHGNGYPEANILHLPNGPARELDPVLASAREKLLAVRGQRKQPLLDTKILTSWNALMIRGLAHAGEVLQEPRYTAAANKAADWLLAHHRQPDGKLLRTSRDGGPAKYDGFLDDYAFLAHAMIALGRHDDARSIVQSMNERFGDEAGGLFFTDRSSHELFSRQKTISDSPLPSGNGIAAQVLLTLGERDAAGKLLESFAGAFGQDAGGMSAILQAADEFINLAPSRGAPALGSEAQARRGEGWREGDVEGSRAVAASAAWQGDRTALVTVTIADGYHINANRVPAGLIKTELIATPTATIAYPPAKKFADDLDVYTGTITLIATWPSPPTESIRLRLNYQPCTDTACLEAKNLIIDLQR